MYSHGTDENTASFSQGSDHCVQIFTFYIHQIVLRLWFVKKSVEFLLVMLIIFKRDGENYVSIPWIYLLFVP